MFKIVITGPESTGKSTLSTQLTNQFKAEMVKEYSRSYLEKLGRPYTKDDLTIIAQGQIAIENKAIETNSKLIICDTSLEVIKIWSEYKYKTCNPLILNALNNRLPNLYLLMTPDLPWKPDPLRENPLNRNELFKLYKKEIETSTVPFHEISGNGEGRFNMAKTFIDNYTPFISL